MSEIVKTDTRELVLPSALPMQPARTVAEVYRTMFVRPLETLQELATFYYNMDSVRGGDKVEKIQRDLLRDHSISYFKGFFMGHYEEKARRLVSIYHQETGNDVPDGVLYKLLLARAVQEFNNIGWFGVHPLVVDILKAHGKLQARVGTNILGGTI